MYFLRFTPSDAVWEGDVPLFVTKPVTAVSGNASCAVRDGFFSGVNDLLSWQFCGRGWVHMLEAAVQGSASLEVESSTQLLCGALLCPWGDTNTVSSLK